MFIKKFINWLLLIFLFLLPWQTRFVYQSRFINGGFWEYGSSSWHATEILLWIIILLSAFELFRNKLFWQNLRQEKRKKVYWFIGLLVVGYFVIEIFNSLSPDISFNFVFRLIGAGCLGVVLVRARPLPALPLLKGEGVAIAAPPPNEEGDRGRFRSTFLFALWLGGVIQGLLATWQFFTQSIQHFPFSGIAPHVAQDLGVFVIEHGDERWLRAYGAFGSPNILGGYLAVTWIVGLLVYLSYRRRGVLKYALVVTVGQLIILSGLILSFSRGAWITAFVGLIVLLNILRGETPTSVLLLIGGGKSDNSTLVARQLVFSLAIILVLFVALKPLFLVRVEAVGRLEQQSIITRAEQLKDFKNIWWHPLLTKEGLGGGLPRLGRVLFGIGPGVYTLALYKNNPTLPVWRYQPIHNIYLLILAELGVVGFVGAVLFCGCFVVLIWKHNRLFLSVIISFFILGLFDHWLWSMYFGLIVSWGTVALLVHKLGFNIDSDPVML